MSRREVGEVDVEEIVDRLYGLPPAEFTGARNEAVRELRKAGRREDAERVKALRRPTVAAGAVNRLVREHRGEVDAFLSAAAALRDAQFAGKGDLAAATRREREALGRLIGIGGEDVRQTILAAAVDDDAAQLLLQARLERELEPRGFGTLLAHAGGRRRLASVGRAAAAPAASPSQAPREGIEPGQEPPPGDPLARARVRRREAALTAARATERDARRRREQTQKELEKAASAVEQAQRELDKATAAVERAQRDVDRLQDG